MLASIRGTVLKKEDFTAVVECSGFGVEVLTSQRAADSCKEGASVFLYTFLQTSEAGMALYGFADLAERRIFKMMMGIKGIGGKVAISMLQHLSPAEIVSAVLEGDAKTLTATPGIGKRTADRICFELAANLRKGGFEDFSGDNAGGGKTSSSGAFSVLASRDGGDATRGVVLDALESLGFERTAALRAYNALASEGYEGKDESDVIMRCLRKLQPRK